MKKLRDLRVISLVGKERISVNPIFQQTFKTCLSGIQPVAQPMKKDKKPPSLSSLDRHARDTWENVLHFIVNSSVDVSQGIKSLLEWSNLVAK